MQSLESSENVDKVTGSTVALLRTLPDKYLRKHTHAHSHEGDGDEGITFAQFKIQPFHALMGLCLWVLLHLYTYITFFTIYNIYMFVFLASPLKVTCSQFVSVVFSCFLSASYSLLLNKITKKPIAMIFRFFMLVFVFVESQNKYSCSFPLDHSFS